MAAVRRYVRSPFASVKGFTQFKRNMQTMAKVGDSDTLVAGFVGIAQDMRIDMNMKLRTKLKPETTKYLRWKEAQVRKRKSGSTRITSLRNKGVVAKKFKRVGKSKSFVAINFKFAPHANWMEFGTAERYTKKGAYRGKVPKGGARTKFAFFRPTVNEWKRSGRYVQRVERAVRTAVDVQAKHLMVWK